MSNVAFEDLATPSVFDATHQYVPASCSFLFCIARKKKRDPSGKRIRCDEASSGAVATSWPSLNHSITGMGDPLARQSSVTGSFFITVLFNGFWRIVGMEPVMKILQKLVIIRAFQEI